jgi:hypothetical protein
MIGSIIGTGIGAIGSIIGSVSAANQIKKYRNLLEQSKTENEDWYNRRYNEDATQRASAQRAITQTQEAIKERNKQAAATAAVTGGTEESVAATKEANAKALADTTSAIVANGEARKDNVESTYLNNKANINQQIGNTYVQTANAISQATQSIGQAASGVGTGVDNYLDAKKAALAAG